MNARHTRRGWPLLSLGLLLAGWVMVRAAMWEMPSFGDASVLASPASTSDDGSVRGSPELAPYFGAAASDHSRAEAQGPDEMRDVDPAWLQTPAPPVLERPALIPVLQADAAVRSRAGRGGMRRADRLVAHALLLAAGYQAVRPPGNPPYRAISGNMETGSVPVLGGVQPSGASARMRRWSFDLWSLWREDTTTPITSGRPSYGRSQAGAVMRYHLSPSSSHAPQLHLRATHALQGAKEADLAAGVSARPLGIVPIRLAAEARVSETDRGSELRASAFAVTELPPMALPAQLTGEAYLQGGYVSGDFATPFVDGQARITRDLLGNEDFRLTAGGGAWGGWQDEGGRLDIGPSAGISFRIGEASGRVSADYRFRVAGEAEPASGPALTLSAGF